MQVVLEKFLHRLLPDDIHERCRGRSFVSSTLMYTIFAHFL